MSRPVNTRWLCGSIFLLIIVAVTVLATTRHLSDPSPLPATTGSDTAEVADTAASADNNAEKGSPKDDKTPSQSNKKSSQSDTKPSQSSTKRRQSSTKKPQKPLPSPLQSPVEHL